MSIDLNWEALTSGPDGDALAERIRSFIHDKFQTVPLPRFIRSVNVHGFDFGSIPPELELKDITDPLPDFYEQLLDDGESESEGSRPASPVAAGAGERERPDAGPGRDRRRPAGLRPAALLPQGEAAASCDMGSPFLGTSTPGILGGPGRNYFQGHLGTGTHTPLAAVAGAQLGGGGWIGGGGGSSAAAAAAAAATSASASASGPALAAHVRHPSQSSVSADCAPDLAAQVLREKSSVSTLAPTSVSASRPPTRDPQLGSPPVVEEDDEDDDDDDAMRDADRRGPRERRVEDVQAVFRIRYGGDVRLNLTAEILLDYPMPSFVGIPIKLSIAGLSFDGVGVLAHMRKRVHFCFLSPDDALMAVGPDCDRDAEGEGDAEGDADGPQRRGGRFAGLFQEVKVESEIGERDGGKQSLKNVGKVERFVLEQVRRIFEEEFVYPSFWTFLV